MNAVGKTRLGKRLASKLGLKRIDSDTVFSKEHGDPKKYVNDFGWDAFRKIEEEIVLEALKPGNLVVLGGGAIESDVIRNELKKDIAVIWISANPKRITKQIRKAKKRRPEFEEGDANKVSKELSDKRNSLYEEVANIKIHENIPFHQFVPIATAELRKYYK